MTIETRAIAVLLSGGLDSAVLAAYAAREATVQPIYVSTGMAWEAEERRMLDRLLNARTIAPHVLPLADLQVDMRDVYPASHWAVRGEPPGYDTPDEDVYIEGRNIVLLSKAAVFMARSGIARVMIGPLAGNPFPDATAGFFERMQEALSLGLASRIEIEAPFADMRKEEVIRLGLSLGVPLELTVSCMQPRDGRGCAKCSKCRERAEAFGKVGIADPALERWTASSGAGE